MAEDTLFAHLDPRTQTKWSKKTYEYTLQDIELSNLMGTSADNVIQIYQELKDSPGDQIKTQLEGPLTNPGIGNDGRVMDNTESLTIFNDNVIIAERGLAVVAGGKITIQRTMTRIQDTAQRQLSSWAAEELEEDMAAGLSGLYNRSGIETINEVVPSPNRILYLGQTTAGVVTTYTTDAFLSAGTIASSIFGTQVIDRAKRLALAASPKFRPLIVDGKKYFIMLISQLQLKALRQDTIWQAAHSNADLRGKSNKIFTGADTIWNGVIVKAYDRCHSRTGAGTSTPAEGFLLNGSRTATTDPIANGRTVDRAIFLGKQAGTLAWGQMPKRTIDMTDGGRLPVTTVDMLYGFKKAQFSQYNSISDVNVAQEDFATLVVDTQVQAD